MFVEHDFKPKFKGTPLIYIAHEAYMDMWYLVQEVGTEVGWLCVVNQQTDGSFLISEVVLPKQQCHAATTELNEEGLALIYDELMNEDAAKGISPVSEEFRAAHLNCWIHSHVDMSVNPSTQDDQQMADFCTKYGEDYDWWIRGIMNKKREARFTLYFKAMGQWCLLDDVPWQHLIPQVNDGRRGAIKELVKERVSYIGAPTTKMSYYPQNTPGMTYKPASHLPSGGTTKTPSHETTILTPEDIDEFQGAYWYGRKRGSRRGESRIIVGGGN